MRDFHETKLKKLLGWLGGAVEIFKVSDVGARYLVGVVRRNA